MCQGRERGGTCGLAVFFPLVGVTIHTYCIPLANVNFCSLQLVIPKAVSPAAPAPQLISVDFFPTYLPFGRVGLPELPWPELTGG